MAIALEIYSTGESCPSFSGESIVIIQAVYAETANLTVTLPPYLDVMSVLPSTRGQVTLSAGKFTLPAATAANVVVGDKFYLIGHYGKQEATTDKSPATTLAPTSGS